MIYRQYNPINIFNFYFFFIDVSIARNQYFEFLPFKKTINILI